MTLVEQLGSFASRLQLEDVPERVQSFTRSQVLSQLAAARATLRHPLGHRIVNAFGGPLQEDPKSAAFCLSVLSLALDFDDTLQTVRLEVLANTNCGYRNLQPGLPTN